MTVKSIAMMVAMVAAYGSLASALDVDGFEKLIVCALIAFAVVVKS